MVDFVSNLVIGFKNTASGGIRALNADLQDQKKAVNDLRNAERQRATESQKTIAAQRVSIANAGLTLSKEKEASALKRAAFFNTPVETLKAEKAKLGTLSAEAKLNTAKERALSLEKKLEIQAKSTAVQQKSGISGFTSGIFEAVTASNLLAGAISGGIGLAIQAAQAGIELFSQQLSSAVQTQNSVISNSTVLSREFNISRSQARSYVVEQQKLVEILGRKLPVSARDINENLSLAQNTGLTKLAGGDLQAYQKLAIGNEQDLGLIPGLALLKAQLGDTITGVQYQQAIGSLAGASKVSDLSKLEFFRTSGLSQQLKDLNFDNAKTGIERLKIYTEGVKNLLPPEAVAEMQGTLPALWSNFTDTLFNDRTGILGFLRDVDPTIAGDQTVFASASQTMKLLFGANGTFEQLGKLTDGFDPLTSVKASIDDFNSFLEKINATFAALNNIPGLSKGVNWFVKAVTSDPFEQARSAKPKYMGDYISAASGFYGALSSEMSNKPMNSSIVIANSSETILRPEQLDRLRNVNQAIGATATGKTVNLTISPGAVTIYAASNDSVDSLAAKVIQRLSESIDNKLSTSYSF